MVSLDRQRIVQAFPIACALILLPLCFLGYGTDNDTYSVLDAGRVTWHLHIPFTSRNPGYWTFEAIVYVLDSLGGSVATNVATLAMAIVLIGRFLVIADRIGVRYPLLLAGSLVATPVFAIAATSTVDYLWSLLGIVLFAELLIADRPALAILPAAFAFAIRGANGVLIAGAIAGALAIPLLYGHRITMRSLRLVGVGVAAAILGGLPYIESWRLAHHSFAFTHALTGSDGMWTLRLQLGRFVYKSLYLFGPVASVILAFAVFARRAPHPILTPYRTTATPIFIGIVLANLLLFLRYPIEISYLLPAGFFGLLLLGISLFARERKLTVAFLVAVVSLNLFNPQWLRPNVPGHATSARLHAAIEPGVMLADLHLRVALRDCEDYRCYYLHFHPGSRDLDLEPLK
jgi:hypothetical protein